MKKFKVRLTNPATDIEKIKQIILVNIFGKSKINLILSAIDEVPSELTLDMLEFESNECGFYLSDFELMLKDSTAVKLTVTSDVIFNRVQNSDNWALLNDGAPICKYSCTYVPDDQHLHDLDNIVEDNRKLFVGYCSWDLTINSHVVRTMNQSSTSDIKSTVRANRGRSEGFGYALDLNEFKELESREPIDKSRLDETNVGIVYFKSTVSGRSHHRYTGIVKIRGNERVTKYETLVRQMINDINKSLDRTNLGLNVTRVELNINGYEVYDSVTKLCKYTGKAIPA